ncbi:hypothetical protein [Oryzobacter telluris]|uniref:hypothetical protein n=1 Tax=Oryzobacter telluris TaxID=3149179 RepID=UPI00370D3668
MTTASDASTRQLIHELAAIEERMYILRAARAGSDATSPVSQELLRLTQREQHVLAQLRLHRASH